MLPLKTPSQNHQERPYIEEYANKLVPRALYVRAADITLTKVNIITGCNAAMCDSQHDESTPCPAGSPDFRRPQGSHNLLPGHFKRSWDQIDQIDPIEDFDLIFPDRKCYEG